MERRISLRAQVDVPICAFVDGYKFACRAVDLSPLGMVFEPTRALARREVYNHTPYEIFMPGSRSIRARARPVWRKGGVVAVKFVAIHDVDRLTLAEMLDRKVRLREPLH